MGSSVENMALTLTLPKKMVEEKLSDCKEGETISLTGKITSLNGEAVIEIQDVSAPYHESDEGQEEEQEEVTAKKKSKMSSAAMAVLARDDD